MVEVGVIRPRRQFGRVSVWLALGTFVATTTTVLGFYQIPQSSAVWSVAVWIMMAVFFLAAPLAHLVGFVLGLVAIFRADDRRALGALGVVLNVLFVSIGAALVYFAAVGLASFR